MEINIKAEVMFDILVEQGIDEMQAKAIIFDLLYVAEGGGVPSGTKPIPRTAPRPRPSIRPEHIEQHHEVQPPSTEQQNSEQTLSNIEMYEQTVPDNRRTLGNSKRVSGARGQRPDFSGFGGPAQSPTFTGNK